MYENFDLLAGALDDWVPFTIPDDAEWQACESFNDSHQLIYQFTQRWGFLSTGNDIQVKNWTYTPGKGVEGLMRMVSGSSMSAH